MKKTSLKVDEIREILKRSLIMFSSEKTKKDVAWKLIKEPEKRSIGGGKGLLKRSVFYRKN